MEEDKNVNVGEGENFTPDPDQEGGFEVGQGEATGQASENSNVPIEEPETSAGAPSSEPSTTAPADPVANVAERLGGEAKEEEKAGSTAPEAGNPLPFDFNDLSKEQIQALKARLNATPDASTRKRKNPIVKLRQIDGNTVIDFKNAFLGTTNDPETGKEIERHFIPVRFLDAKEDEFVNVLYSKFINSPQVECEVVDHKEKKEPIVEGEVFSREEGRVVEQVRTILHQWFTVKLPNGKEIELEARIVNG